MDVLKQVGKAKGQLRAAVTLIDKAILQKESELAELREARGLALDLDSAPQVRAKRKPKSTPAVVVAPAVVALEKLAKTFDLAEARKVFGKKAVGVRIAQLSRRGVIKKVDTGVYEKVA